MFFRNEKLTKSLPGDYIFAARQTCNEWIIGNV